MENQINNDNSNIDFKIIKRQLPVQDYLSYISFVVKMCFRYDKDKNTYFYVASNKHIGIKLAFLTFFTDSKKTKVSNSFDVMASFNISDFEKEISMSQISEMLEIINDDIEYKKLQLLHGKPIFDNQLNATKLKLPQDHKIKK